MFMAAFNSLEYVFCYNDEKEKFYKKLKDLSDGRAMSQRNASSRRAMSSDCHYGSIEGGSGQEVVLETHSPPQFNEVLPLMTIDRNASPSLSCDADISSLNGESDDDDVLSSHCNSDNVVPKDTDVTDFTNDEFLSEVDDDHRASEPTEVVCDGR